MQRSGVRLSVRLSVHCSLATFAGLLLCARWAGDIDRLQHDGCSAAAAPQCEAEQVDRLYFSE